MTTETSMDWITILTSSAIVGAVNVIVLFWIKERLKQSIKFEYDLNLEGVKKDLEFELDKKKRLYEGKLSQYKKYFSLLDSYSSGSRSDVFEKYQQGLLALIRDPSEENTAKYIEGILPLQSNISDVFLQFKTEINGLRLEAGEKLLALLDEYIAALEIAQNKTVKMIHGVNDNLSHFINNPNEMQEYINTFMQSEFSTDGTKLIELQDRIFRKMRHELGIV